MKLMYTYIMDKEKLVVHNFLLLFKYDILKSDHI